MLWEEAGHLFLFVMASIIGLVILGLIAGWVYDQWLKWTGRPR